MYAKMTSNIFKTRVILREQVKDLRAYYLFVVTFFFVLVRLGMLMAAIWASTASSVFSVCSSLAFSSWISISPENMHP